MKHRLTLPGKSGCFGEKTLRHYFRILSFPFSARAAATASFKALFLSVSQTGDAEQTAANVKERTPAAGKIESFILPGIIPSFLSLSFLFRIPVSAGTEAPGTRCLRGATVVNGGVYPGSGAWRRSPVRTWSRNGPFWRSRGEASDRGRSGPSEGPGKD